MNRDDEYLLNNGRSNAASGAQDGNQDEKKGFAY